MKRLASLWTLFLFSSCAHYVYVPEIAGEGARVGRGGIVFQMPTANPLLKVKIISSGVTSAPSDAGLGKDSKMVQVRMLFIRTPSGEAVPVTLDPSEVTLVLPGGNETRPGLVHGAAHRGRVINLGPARKQAIDFWFPLPGTSGAQDFQSFSLRWRVHCGSLNPEQLTRFDRQDTGPQQGAELFPWDADFPYDLSPVLPPGWVYEPLPWWSPFPF